jgi:hypothetical protein
VHLVGAQVARKHAAGPQWTLVYQVDWPASIRRVDERTFEHVVANDCVLSMFLRDELEQIRRPVPAHKLVADFRSSGRVTALLSEEGPLYQARFPATWLRMRMIVHDPMELYRMSLKMGDPDPGLLSDGLRSVGVSEDVVEHLAGLEVERTKRGRPPENKGKLQIRDWIMLLEVLGWLWRGKTRADACELVAPFHGLKPDTLNRGMLPPLSEFKNYSQIQMNCGSWN